MNRLSFNMIFFLLIFQYALASEDIRLHSFVDKAITNTDDEIRFTVTLSHPKDASINIPDIGPQIQGLSIKEFGDKSPETIKDVTLKEKWFILKASLSGTYQLPAVEIKFNNQDYKTSPVFVEFKDGETKKSENETDIRDIKDIYHLPFNYLWPLIILVVLLLVAASFWFYKFRYKRSRPYIIIPPHELALGALLQIKNMQFDSRQSAKLFSFKLSEIIRIYIEALIGVNVTDKTTGEIKKSIYPVSTLSDEHKKTFIKILEDLDLIKFTDILPDNSKKDELYNYSFTLVENTKPKIVEPEEDVV